MEVYKHGANGELPYVALWLVRACSAFGFSNQYGNSQNAVAKSTVYTGLRSGECGCRETSLE